MRVSVSESVSLRESVSMSCVFVWVAEIESESACDWVSVSVCVRVSCL